MKAHDISPKGALVGGPNGPAAASSPSSAPKKRATKKRKVQADSEEDDEVPEVKKEVKAEKKPKQEAKHVDDGSFLLSDIPHAPPSSVKKEESRGDGTDTGADGGPDACHACAAEQAVKREPVLKFEHTPLPHAHPPLDHGGAFPHTTEPAAPTQSFGHGTNSGFQSLAPAQMPLPMTTMNSSSNGPPGVFPGGSWLQTGPQHYFWNDKDQL